MRKNRRIAALLTAGLLALTPCVSAGMMYASAENCTITVDNSVEGYEYTAYKIFKGDKSGEDPNFVLSNLDWADGFKGAEFLTALKGDSVLGTTFASANNPEAVATALDTIKTDNNKLAQFAKLAFANKGTTTSVASTYDATKGYSIPATEAGYYLVEETSVPSGAITSRYMLKVAGPTDVSPKRPTPSLTKEIVGPNVNGDKDANTASVGDLVEYKINSSVPDMTGYSKYFFVVNDTMEDGLTFNPGSVVVKINGVEIDADDDYEVQVEDAAKVGDTQYTFQIVLKNFIQYNTSDYIGKPIEITYNATVNNAATAGSTTQDANENEANLTYSNNPNITPHSTTDEPTPDDGNPETPDDGAITGNTPKDITYTYLTNLEIVKVDKDNHETTLQGAKFELTGESLQAVYHEQGIYKKDSTANPAYYLLKDGTYTDVAPTEGTASSYVDGIDAAKYALVTESDENYSTMNKVTAYGESGTDGKVTFGKLGEGTYTIVETKSPTGYNKLANPIKIQITATPSDKGCTWSYKKDNGTASNSNSFMIENSQGSTLPSTGGVGTKLFYLFGGMLAVGSGVVLVTKKRMSYEK